jgi:hypothetical protein
MNSPLGRYSQIVAAVVAVGVIGAYLVAILIGQPEEAAELKDFALIALGAVFGSAAALNGYKRDSVALHSRLDKAHIPPAGGTG